MPLLCSYQFLQSDGNLKSVQGNIGHATAAVLMDTYAHTQDKPPAGADREDRGKLLFPKYVPGSTPTPAKRKAGGNKNLRQGDSSSHPADGRRRTQRVDEKLVRLTFLPFMQRKAGCAHLAQKDLIFGKCATGMQKVCSHFPT